MGMLDMNITQDMLNYYKKVIPSGRFAYFRIDDSLEGILYHPTVLYIGTRAFDNVNVGQLDLPNVQYIDEKAFYGGIVSGVNLPNLKQIGSTAFYNSSLGDVSLPKIQYIDATAFTRSGLRSITLGSDLTYIGGNAFEYNSNLTTINIYAPKSQVATAALAPWSAPSTCQVNWLGGE